MPREKVREWDREHTFPPELFAKLAALGVCGLTVDREYGDRVELCFKDKFNGECQLLTLPMEDTLLSQQLHQANTKP